MSRNPIKLTREDELILKSYMTLAEGLGSYLGESCEVILHSLADLEHSVVMISGGAHSGRTKGSPITDLGLSLISEIEEHPDTDHLNYFNKDESGADIKSCTIVIRGSNHKPIGFLCINCYLGTPLDTILRGLTPPGEASAAASLEESFAGDTASLIGSALRSARDQVFRDPSVSSGNINKEIVLLLYEKGIFNLKDAVNEVAHQMHISKNTVYMNMQPVITKPPRAYW